MAVERKFIQDRLKKLQVKEWLMQEVRNAGFGGVDIVRTPLGTQVSLLVERPGLVIGRGGRRIKMLQEKLKEFGLDNPQISVDEIEKPEFNAQLMATLLARALERGWYFRRAGYRFLYRIMEAGAKGCEIEISGKLTSERARTEKFVAGIMIHTGDPAYELVRKGFDIAIKKLGVYGVSVRIIPPDVELPDEFKVKEVSKEELEALKAKIMGGGSGEDGGDKKDEQGGETKET
ncbi:MAG TPA: 30S ribosomal protein S3 [Archaeoglobus profundus]|nr:30S ribosomal protein S3 [Archaeoglobus profundus]HIP58705.1 30S ribosomal protein S3 [Archaeoglobus profundus]